MVARTEDPEARSRKMSRRPRAVTYSPVTRRFRELFATHAEAERRKLPVAEIAGERQEHGGAFINPDETAIRSLAKNLGLKEEIVNGGDRSAGKEIYWFDGKPYTYDDANADWGSVGYPVFQGAYKQAPWPQRYNSSTSEGKRLDGVAIPDWLDQTGISSS